VRLSASGRRCTGRRLKESAAVAASKAVSSSAPCRGDVAAAVRGVVVVDVDVARGVAVVGVARPRSVDVGVVGGVTVMAPPAVTLASVATVAAAVVVVVVVVVGGGGGGGGVGVGVGVGVVVDACCGMTRADFRRLSSLTDTDGRRDGGIDDRRARS